MEHGAWSMEHGAWLPSGAASHRYTRSLSSFARSRVSSASCTIASTSKGPPANAYPFSSKTSECSSKIDGGRDMPVRRLSIVGRSSFLGTVCSAIHPCDAAPESRHARHEEGGRASEQQQTRRRQTQGAQPQSPPGVSVCRVQAAQVCGRALSAAESAAHHVLPVVAALRQPLPPRLARHHRHPSRLLERKLGGGPLGRSLLCNRVLLRTERLLLRHHLLSRLAPIEGHLALRRGLCIWGVVARRGEAA